MNTMREQVSHTKFGAGTVIAQDTTTVTVKFSKEYGDRKFLYPSAFKTYLALLNSSAKEQMDDELKSIRDTAEMEQNSRFMEREKMRAMLEAKNAPKKRAPAKKRAPKKVKVTESTDSLG